MRRLQHVESHAGTRPSKDHVRTRAAIEILYVEDCPNHSATIELVELLVDEGGLEADIRPIRVSDAEDARRRRFLGSPTIRVDGRDVEPGADDRDDYVLACRLYQTEQGPAGIPDPRWIVWALEQAAIGRRSDAA